MQGTKRHSMLAMLFAGRRTFFSICFRDHVVIFTLSVPPIPELSLSPGFDHKSLAEPHRSYRRHGSRSLSLRNRQEQRLTTDGLVRKLLTVPSPSLPCSHLRRSFRTSAPQCAPLKHPRCRRVGRWGAGNKLGSESSVHIQVEQAHRLQAAPTVLSCGFPSIAVQNVHFENPFGTSTFLYWKRGQAKWRGLSCLTSLRLPLSSSTTINGERSRDTAAAAIHRRR